MVFLGGAALMLWFRDQGWHWAGGLVAALAFCYGASMAWRIQHIGQVLSLAYLPIAMLCLDRALARGRSSMALRQAWLRPHRARPRPGGAARRLLPELHALAPAGSGAPAVPCAPALCPCRRVRRSASLIAVPVMLTALLAAVPTARRSTFSAPAAARCIPPLLMG